MPKKAIQQSTLCDNNYKMLIIIKTNKHATTNVQKENGKMTLHGTFGHFCLVTLICYPLIATENSLIKKRKKKV